MSDYDMLYGTQRPEIMGYLAETVEQLNTYLDAEERKRASLDAWTAYRKRWSQYIHLLSDEGAYVIETPAWCATNPCQGGKP